MDAITLTVLIWMAISQRMIGDGTAKLSNLSFTLPKIYKGIPVNGNIDFSATTIRGLQTIKLKFEDIKVEDADKNGNNEVCIKNFDVGNIKLSSKYHADVAFMNIIPFYGDGKFSISFDEIKAEVCFTAISNGSTDLKGLENLKIFMKYRPKPISVQGFMKNAEADELLLQVAELFNVFLAMWHNYEPEEASCFMSPLLEFSVNAQMGYKQNVLKLDADKCLWKGTPFGDLGKIQFQTFATLYQDLIKYIKENKEKEG